MEVIRVPRVMQETSHVQRLRGRSIGFVPTMGALHEGHLSLVRASTRENDMTVTSIFVNPAQFGPAEDFDKYPRDIEGDMAKLRQAGVDTVFVPEAVAIYPEGFSTFIEVKGLSEKLCGPFRPGHFAGVATVVAKLLNIVGPTRAYFGGKDYQQSVIIRKLVADLNVPVEIVTLPTVREADGLAMSSRNRRLSAEQRKAALAIYRSLTRAEQRIASGTRDAGEIERLMRDVLSGEPLITEVQYAGAYDPETLDGLAEIEPGALLLAVAARLGDIRLIDNLLVEIK